MIATPPLGVGVVFFPGLEPLLEAGGDLIDVIEIEPQPFWFKRRDSGHRYDIDGVALERILQYRQAKVVHGVGFPVGATAPLDDDQLGPFVRTVDLLEAQWVSEHMSFLRAGCAGVQFNTGFLLPPVQTDATVAIAAARIGDLKDRLPVPFAFETGVNYLQPFHGEMSDGAFWRAVAETADCGILLDLHNLWANQLNGRQSIRQALAELPLERVWEIHLAGGDRFENYWLDAHSDVVPAELLSITAEVIPSLPNLKAILFEIIPDYLAFKRIGVDRLMMEVENLRRLWSLRREGCLEVRETNRLPSHSPTAVSAVDLPSPSDWETALGGLVIGRQVESEVANRLRLDPGVEVLRQLVSTVRAGMVVECLRLTYRLLVLRLGNARVQEILQAFWQSVPPEPFALEEARNFAEHLQRCAVEVAHSMEVAAFELAAQQAMIDGCARAVKFTCDPMPLLNALGEFRLPEAEIAGEFELVIDPPLLSHAGAVA